MPYGGKPLTVTEVTHEYFLKNGLSLLQVLVEHICDHRHAEVLARMLALAHLMVI